MLNSHATWQRRLVDRLILRFSKKMNFDGLWIGAFSGSEANVLEKVHRALHLLKTYDPFRYKRMHAQFDKILVQPMPVLGKYVPELRRCVLDTDYVETASVERIASTIVHEAAHGELIRRGIGYDESIRQRVEDICTRQELAFARKLPDAKEILERAEQKFSLPAETWSDEMQRQRDVDWLRQGSFPEWILRPILAGRRWKDKRRG